MRIYDSIADKRSRLLLALFFVVLQLVVIARNLASDYFSFFWYCDFVPALFAAAFLFGSHQAVKGLVNIGLLPQLGYIVVIFSILTVGVAPFGFIVNFPLTAEYLVPTLFIHLTSAFALVATLQVKPKPIALLYSLLFLFAVYAVVLVFTEPSASPAGNYNFIYHSETFAGFEYYTELWVVLAFFFLALPTYLLQRSLFYLFRQSSKNMRGKAVRAVR